MRLRPHRPREVAQALRRRARLAPREVEEYLDTHAEEWTAIAEAHPHDAADILEELGEDAASDLLAELDPDDAAEVLEEMQDDLAADLLEELDPETAADFLQEMPADEAADLVAALEPEAREGILEAMDDPAEADVRRLLAYPPDSAGGLMTTEVAILPIGMTAGEAIERVRQMNEELDLSYVYIVDDDDRLVGVLSFRDLVFKRPGVGLEEAMIPNPVAVSAYADREEAADLTQRYHLFSIPVVDDQQRLLGMVTNDELIEAIQSEASEDFAVATGAGARETVFTGAFGSVGMRLPWLSLNLVMALLVAYAIEQQTGVISREPVLAALMPIIATLGGNSGFQSLAVVIRSLATDDIPRSQVGQVIGRQFSVGVLNGMILGVLGSATWILRNTSAGPGTREPVLDTFSRQAHGLSASITSALYVS
ncbi:MAG: magnesium transporter, partial [Acidimicrobiia bacterium]